MGTTRAAFDAGSTKYALVASIQGYSYLLTDGSTTAAVTAWAGSDWDQALPGLFVEMKQDQALDPDDPFANAGGSCTIYVHPDPSDTFGIDSARRGGGAETYLEASLDRNDSTIAVKSTSAFASTGTIYIGTEAINYAGKTDTTFTLCTRGKWSGVRPYIGNRFGHDHRVDFDANGVKLQPLVSERPRQWLGRWVEVYAHRVVDGVLDTKAQAHRLYAGRITEMRDDANTGCRVLSIGHVLSTMKEIVIGSGAWEGSVNDTVRVVEGDRFTMTDGLTAVSEDPRVASPLVVVASGASGVYQMAAGDYSHEVLAAQLTQWLIAAKAAGQLWTNYVVSSPVDNGAGELHTEVRWNGSSSTTGWRLAMPPQVASFLGFTEAVIDLDNTSLRSIQRLDPSNFGTHRSASPCLRLSIIADGGEAARFPVNSRTGTVADQFTTLPQSIRPTSSSVGGTTYRWGLFMVNDERMVVAAWNSVGDFDGSLRYVRAVLQPADAEPDNHIALSTGQGNTLIIRQIFAFENKLSFLLPALLMSTGTNGYNVSSYGASLTNYDVYPTGAGLPWSLFGDAFFDDVLTLPGADGTITVIIDRPTKLSELIASDLIMRWAFPVWRDGAITFDSWKVPSADRAELTLTESDKAEPSGQTANPRSSTQETDKWQRSIVKIRYNRDATDPRSDEYRSTVIFEDRVAVDDAGGDGKVKTISLRNTYKEFGGTGQSVEALLPQHMTLMPLISRPANIVRRSIDLRYFFSLSLGEVALFTDAFARDPETGERGVSNRPALVVRHMLTLGGLTPDGGTQPMTGEVELFFTDLNTDRISATYVPSGDVDDTHDDGDFDAGYNSVTNTLRLYAHRYSESSEAVDASHFEAGYKVLIVERDPLDATAPASWEREVASVSGSDIVLTTGLSSPAWDATKYYRVLFQPYDSAAAQQRAKVYQADDGDGIIIDIAQPYLYGSAPTDSTYTAEGASPEIELVPDVSMEDGAARDVGHESALIRQIDNFLDYKSCIQQPMLFNAIVGNLTYTTGFRLVAYWPIFLSYEIPSNAIYRLLTVAPMARSYDGTSASLKLSLWRDRPGANSLNALPSPSGAYSTVTWTGITSTSMAVLTEDELVINVKHPFTGQAWMVLELGYKCQTYGLSRMVEGARVAS